MTVDTCFVVSRHICRIRETVPDFLDLPACVTPGCVAGGALQGVQAGPRAAGVLGDCPHAQEVHREGVHPEQVGGVLLSTAAMLCTAFELKGYFESVMLV